MRIILQNSGGMVCHRITTNVNDPVLDANVVLWRNRYFRYLHSTKIGVGVFQEGIAYHDDYVVEIL